MGSSSPVRTHRVSVYVQHFKCNLGMIRSHYPLINNWLKNLYFNIPGFRETTNFEHIKDNVGPSECANCAVQQTLMEYSIPKVMQILTHSKSRLSVQFLTLKKE